MLVSVVTITRDDADGLRRTLQSVLAQTRAPREVIVVDGMSSDDTPEVVRSLLAPNWSLIREPDSGVYDAMNKGWRAATGSYVQFLNSGDVFNRADALELIQAELQRTAPLWLVVGAQHGFGNDAATIANVPHRWWRHSLGLQSHCHQACFFQKDVLQLLGGLTQDHSFVGDFDLILRAGMLAPPAELALPLISYEGGGLSQQRAAQIPKLLHQVRKERLQLDGGWAHLSAAWACYRRLYQVAVQARDVLRGSRL